MQFNTQEELCLAFHGFPLPQSLIPPPNPKSATVPRDNEPYMEKLQQFLSEGGYLQLGWLHDPYVRNTGKYQGDPPGGFSFGTHLPVRIYYSPEVIEWLCADRKGKCNGVGARVCRTDDQCPAGEPCELLPRGAMMVKTMRRTTSVAVDPDSRCRITHETCNNNDDEPCSRKNECIVDDPNDPIIPPSTKCSFTNEACRTDADCPRVNKCLPNLMWMRPECYDDQEAPAWAVMVTPGINAGNGAGVGREGSHDGWFWAINLPPLWDSPPILGRSAVTNADFFDDSNLFIEHDPTRYPTGLPGNAPAMVCDLSRTPCVNDSQCPVQEMCVKLGSTKKKQSMMLRNYGYGNSFCLSCHASTVSASTFASLDNILGQDILYPHQDSSPGGTCSVSEKPCVDNSDCPDLETCLPKEFETCSEQGGHFGESPDFAQFKYSKPLNELNGKDKALIQVFLSQFPQFTQDMPSIDTVLESRFPAQTYDHVKSTPYDPTPPLPPYVNHEQFVTSDQCSSCHDSNTMQFAIANMNLCRAVPACTINMDCVKRGCGKCSACVSGECQRACCGPLGCNTNAECAGRCGTSNAVCIEGICEIPEQELACQITDEFNLSPFAEWSASPMGLAGRDPIFFAQLESENNLWPDLAPCIDTLCLHCHGVMGQRQLALDNPAKNPVCANFLPPGENDQAFLTSKKFTRDYMDAWAGKNPTDAVALNQAKYGALGREGISCAVCHSIKGVRDNDPSIYTGNFTTGPPNEIYGPYPDANHPVQNHPNVLPQPMERELGITPMFGEDITSSALCGSCHAVVLPVIPAHSKVGFICSAGQPQEQNARVKACIGFAENAPCMIPETTGGTCIPFFKFEQTTYLEWLDSDFGPNGSNETSCQECHMPSTFQTVAPSVSKEDPLPPLAFQIASIEQGRGTGWPLTTNRLPDEEINLPTRGVCYPLSDPRVPCAKDVDCPSGATCRRYARHFLYGLNVFLNEIAQQFPVILGLRQIDFFNTGAEPALLTARDAVIQQAKKTTATIQVSKPILEGDKLSAMVTVTNLTGHKFPSGVGFRRAFIEFLVLDGTKDKSNPIWASGRTNSLGVILDGTSDVVLPTEFFEEVLECPARESGQCYQPHYQTITSENEVQIYEELQQDDRRKFTTSFLARWFDVKDNRLLPMGWKSKQTADFVMAAEETVPFGRAKDDPDPDYPLDGSPAPGADTVAYQITLTEEQLARNPQYVQAKLYFQAIPPYYLNDRFNNPVQPEFPPGHKKTDTERLYWMTSRLNVNVKDGNNEEFIKDWKLQVGSTSQMGINEIPTGACCNNGNGDCFPNLTRAECEGVNNRKYVGDDTECLLGTCLLPPQRGACCDNQPIVALCDDNVLEVDCVGEKNKWFAKTPCSQADCQAQAIPTVSEWGLVILALVLLIGAKLYFGRREVVATD